MKRKSINFKFILCIFYVIQLATASQEQSIDGENFDFIVVGGGTAGCVIAGRLAESGNHTVLLIHEGQLPHPNLTIPALATNYGSGFPNDLKFYDISTQKNAGLANNGAMKYVIGKAIGGGSSVNAMIWNRGHPSVYNRWAAITKDESWNYSSLLKYFKKSEKYAGLNPTDKRGQNGPITISGATYTPGMNEFLEAGKEIGYPLEDSNGPQMASVANIDFSQKNGRRVSSFSGYISPLSDQIDFGSRKNLKIALETEAKRILFEGKRAIGVSCHFKNDSSMKTFKANKEIIISAGVMDSPALLMRSGIGPKDELKANKIPVVQALPVGKNLHDHILLYPTIIYGNRSLVIVPERDLTSEALQIFTDTGKGPYSSYVGITAQGFFNSNLTSSENWPDIHLIPANFEVNSTEVDDLKYWETAVKWVTIFTQARSRGTVTLNPKDIDGPPVIDFQYLSNPDDVQGLVYAMKHVEKLCKTKVMQRVGCRLPSSPLPSCQHLTFRSDEYYTCYIKQVTSTSLHAGGTCRMGSGFNDTEAVVDSELKVIGIEGLRVADASVMPIVTNANTQTPVYLIAEKAADLILKKWNNELIVS